MVANRSMKKLVILGAGTAGTMMLNKLANELDSSEWSITIVDQFETHYYQPGFLFIPFGIYNKKDVIKPKRDFFPSGTEVIISGIDKIEPDHSETSRVNGLLQVWNYNHNSLHPHEPGLSWIRHYRWKHLGGFFPHTNVL